MAEPRVAVVTGGGRGIGRGIVLELARLGLRIGVNYRSDCDAARGTCAEAIERGAAAAVPFQADISDLSAGSHLVERVLDAFGRIDVWIHNAGVAPRQRRDLLETTPESWDDVLNTNLRGPFFLTQAVARAMRSHPEPEQADRQIHFITSVSAIFASVQRGEYCVAKAGLSMVARLFAARLAAEGIRVFEIRPGIIRTDMTAPVAAAYQARIDAGLLPIARIGEPAEVGRAVAAVVAGGLPYATGSVIEIDGGMHLRRL
jgi:NAD(P)-dependent dehydrogenase (short-subunit alcohol dehydrogenase family)